MESTTTSHQLQVMKRLSNSEPHVREIKRQGTEGVINVSSERDLHTRAESRRSEEQDKDGFLRYVDGNVIGCNTSFTTPYGTRRIVYCDYTASGRALHFIEDFITNEVLPFYANTHTTTGIAAKHSTNFLQDARNIIRDALNASMDDAVIFTGSGSTGAIHKLVRALEIKFADGPKPVILIGPFEHHSNILPFRDNNWEVIRIREGEDGQLDYGHLEEQLQEFHKTGRPMVGTFSAASNVTGILTDTVAVSTLLHRYGALSLWDYATAAPYVKIDMHPSGEGVDGTLAYKDAVFISPHKFVGGVNTPGLLVAKSDLFSKEKPTGSGGGVVVYVTRSMQRYLADVEAREEAGTCNIIGAIRAGLAFQLKERIGAKTIMEREHFYLRKGLQVLGMCPSLNVLGLSRADRLPIFSFVVKHQQTNRYIHYGFLSALLNDLFGIQTRGGCMCAGPYALDLLGIEEDMAMNILQLEEDPNADRNSKKDVRRKLMRPGFTRFSLPYFMNEDDVDFVLAAVAMVAEQGWKLLPYYTFDVHSGDWWHVDSLAFEKSLSDISYPISGDESSGVSSLTSWQETSSQGTPTREELLLQAEQLFQKAEEDIPAVEKEDLQLGEHKDMLWFLTPSEAVTWLQSLKTQSRKVPFSPRKQSSTLLISQNLSYCSWRSMPNITSLPVDQLEDDRLSRKTSLNSFQHQSGKTICRPAMVKPADEWKLHTFPMAHQRSHFSGLTSSDDVYSHDSEHGGVTNGQGPVGTISEENKSISSTSMVNSPTTHIVTDTHTNGPVDDSKATKKKNKKRTRLMPKLFKGAGSRN